MRHGFSWVVFISIVGESNLADVCIGVNLLYFEMAVRKVRSGFGK